MSDEAPNSSATTTDWPTQITDTIVNLIDGARVKITDPLATATRLIVPGIIAVVLGVMALVMIWVSMVRGFDVLAQVLLEAAGFEHAGRSTWVAHLMVGLIFCLAGRVLLALARRAHS